MARLRVIAGGKAEGEPLGPSITEAPGVLEALYLRHAPGVFARCRYLLKDEEAAKDATQDVFAKALRALPEFRAAASPTTWLARIATHHCLNQLRGERAKWREELARMAGEAREGPQPEKRELVRALLAVAEEEAQEMAVLYFVDELTQAEIAEATGRSLPTVRKRLRDFLAAARAALREAWPDVTLPEGDEP